MAPGQAKLTFAVSKVFSACNEPWNYCMPSKMAADEKPKEQVPQAEGAWKQNLKHKVSFLIWIVGEIPNQNLRMHEPLPVQKSRTGCDETYDEQLLAGWQPRSRVRRGEMSAEVGFKEQNNDVKVLSSSQNGLTQIRFDLITGAKSAVVQKSLNFKSWQKSLTHFWCKNTAVCILNKPRNKHFYLI